MSEPDVQTLEAQLAAVKQELERSRQREAQLDAQLHSSANPLFIRKQWRDKGERLVNELGGVLTVARTMDDPRVWAVLEGRDLNLLGDILRRLDSLAPWLRALAPRVVDADPLATTPSTAE